jgi:predicted pyridoxine 5'-phosphate oxidase superfamily flavin-nucleotide-binding protein
MSSRYLEIATTPTVAAAQEHYGSAAHWARPRARSEPGDGEAEPLGPPERAFVAARDGFYVASVSETGWPYVQYRGGPPGFLVAVDAMTLGFADFRGNRQYITTGNVRANERVSLFLMDYAHRQRLKIYGRMRIVDAADDAALAARLVVPGYSARVERLVLVTVAAYDWNCPQHITPRFTEAELAEALAPVRDELAGLRLENERLRRALASRDHGGGGDGAERIA